MHRKRGRHSGKNLPVNVRRRSIWKTRSSDCTPLRTKRPPTERSFARSRSANAQKLSESSDAPRALVQSSASTIRNSISPFGVSRERRIALSE